MNPPAGQHEVLPFDLPTALVVLLALAAIAAWAALHLLRRKVAHRGLSGPLLAASVAVGFIALLAVLEAAQNVVVFATNWPLWPLALLAAVAVEALLLLYRLERRIVPRRTGMALGALRVAVALLVVAMLCRPVRPYVSNRTIERYVAVLVDDSASMHVPDTNLGPSDKLRLAEALWPQAPRRPCRFEVVARRLAEVRARLAAQADWLVSLRAATAEQRRAQLEDRRRDVRSLLEDLQETVAQHTRTLDETLNGDLELDERTGNALSDLTYVLHAQVGEPLAEAAGLLDSDNLPGLATDPTPLLERLQDAAAALREKVEPRLAAVGEAIDEIVYRSLPEDRRQQVDEIALQPRAALARSVLLEPQVTDPEEKETGPSLLEQLRQDYGVKLYTFAAEPLEVDADSWQATGPPAASAEGEGNGPGAPPEKLQTDIAAALEKVISEMPADRLAGVVVLSDGQHNADTRLEPLARRIGRLRVPICSVVFGKGPERPTTDAAVVDVNAPETKFIKDTVLVQAKIKLDGLRGRTVRVALYDGESEVPVSAETIPVGTDAYRHEVSLSDEPSEARLHDYRVQVQDVEGEVLATNNQQALAVSVSDKPTHMLILEERPRWEFRYLKNLFASRDRSVKLQYALLEPDRIDGQPPRPPAHASAARPREEPEATLPPKDEAEWMKFDLIVLGDVGPETLREADLEAIKRFVEERAGTLVVICGPRSMPHAYADTDLAEMIPVSFQTVDQEDVYLQAPEPRFRVALTPEGRQSVTMRLELDPEDNLELWSKLPDIHWRHPTTAAKEGATVLAYALPPEPPDFLAPGEEEPDEATARKRQEFIRDHALISLHHVALGRVFLLSFDRTWRLRYRVGDPHHHRFWGQVLRWATADKLPAGTDQVRLGPGRSRYPAGSRVRVNAQLVGPDLSTVVSDQVWANVYQGDRLVLRERMEYVPNSRGRYTADVGELPGGTYRVELEAPAVAEHLAEEGIERLSCDFAVEKAVPAEQIELAADRGRLHALATPTHGVVVEPAHAAQLLQALGPGTTTHLEPRQWELWDSWPFLVLIVGLAGTEWFLRKRARLP
ncbi:MAG: hypothetical protein ACLF0G_13660 [Candidatus Brocadiia bacterium]